MNKISWINKTIIFLFYVLVISFFIFIPKIYNSFIQNFFSDNTLTIYSFTEVLPKDLLIRFEKKTGIKIRMRFFDTNEELVAKFKVSQGKGYDIITLSDYAIEILIKDNLLQKIDPSKLHNIKYLDERLLGKYFDPQNKYSLPYAWSAYGIIYNKNVFSDEEISWDLVFKRSDDKHYKICMLDDPIESVYLASVYLFSKSDNYNEFDFDKIEKMLIKQKKWVESYTSSNIDYFLYSNIVPLAVIPSYVAKNILKINSNFRFEVPEKKGLIAIESLAIPAGTKKLDMIYKFIDFIISKEAAIYSTFEVGFNPANKAALNSSGVKFLKDNGLFPDDSVFDNLHIINNNISLDVISRIWLNVRLN